jgi:hypothetical protein
MKRSVENLEVMIHSPSLSRIFLGALCLLSVVFARGDEGLIMALGDEAF